VSEPLIPPSLIAVAESDAAEGERTCRMSREVVAAMARADLFRICVPHSLGGREATPGETIGAIETLAEADGAAGWCLMIAATSGIVAGWLPSDVARDVFSSADKPCGGVFAPRGEAAAGQDAYAVTGRWPFSSGVTHSAWMLGGCTVTDDGKPRLMASGAPDVHVLVFARDQLRIDETWSVTGLRGTGSHDMVLEKAAVPLERSVSLLTGEPVEPGPLYAFPVFGLLAVGVAAVGLGIARAALADFVTLAGAKKPSMSRRSLADHPSAQATAANCWARLRSARALLREAVEDAWGEAQDRGSVSVLRRAGVRIAATHAAAEPAAVVEALCHAAGGSSIYTSSPLERRFRDVHTLRAHMIIGPSTAELAGRVLLGAEADTTML